MRELTCKLIERWTVQVLKAQPGGAFSEFGRILIQDGSSFAVHDALSKHYPGRFQPRSPAAVELHVAMDPYRDCASKITLTADTAPERPHLPRAHTLKGDLLLADWGTSASLPARGRCGGRILRGSGQDFAQSDGAGGLRVRGASPERGAGEQARRGSQERSPRFRRGLGSGGEGVSDTFDCQREPVEGAVSLSGHQFGDCQEFRVFGSMALKSKRKPEHGKTHTRSETVPR